jgi:hypothetical protein
MKASLDVPSKGHNRISNIEQQNKEPQKCIRHFDIRNSLFDILRFEVPTVAIFTRMYKILINRPIEEWLMFKRSLAGEDHCGACLIAGLNHLEVSH